jgi:hypothetical protein
MRLANLGWMLALVWLAGCGASGEAPAADGTAEAMRDKFARAAAAGRAEREQAPAPAPGAGRRLDVPLPRGVLPDFDHDLGSDLTATPRHTTRVVTLRARGIDAREALDELAGKFTDAGLEAGAVSGHKDSLRQGFWTPGDGRGVMVVDAGGTHVDIVVRDFAPASESGQAGYSALVVVTVNSP